MEEQRKLENKAKNMSQFVSSSLTDRKQKGTIAEIDDGETEAAQPAHFYELKELISTNFRRDGEAQMCSSQ
ncbi:hypothetical protein BLNAU_12783 [Blattamonas nauphoetae]|uniref:Uncharacterized protein n=1 Tax=Blattamonas nauphoetae TaxID=2049346 RepID=A0ABQ9XN58_9EUKA|nr:hypothetical protein BLNAU_12783 [Blattamonas nauphoetae]